MACKPATGSFFRLTKFPDFWTMPFLEIIRVVRLVNLSPRTQEARTSGSSIGFDGEIVPRGALPNINARLQSLAQLKQNNRPSVRSARASSTPHLIGLSSVAMLYDDYR